MRVKARIDAIDRDVKLLVDETLSPAARTKQFAADAKAMLDDADETNRQTLGRVPRSKTFVDGHEGAALASVQSDGVIVREYELVIDVLLFIADQLKVLSPVGTKPDKRPGHPGFYRASHTLFADGAEISLNGAMPDASEFVFLSTAPYARRIEKRSTIYEMTAAKAAQRFGNIARVKFGWQSPLLSYVAGGANREGRAAQRNQPAKQSAKHIERATRVPAVIVTIGR